MENMKLKSEIEFEKGNAIKCYIAALGGLGLAIAGIEMNSSVVSILGTSTCIGTSMTGTRRLFKYMDLKNSLKMEQELSLKPEA